MFRYMWVLLFLFSIKGVEWWQFLSIFCSFYTYRDSIFLLYDLLKVSSTFLLVNLHIWIEWKYNIYRNACKDLALVWFGFKEATNLNVIQNVSLFCENFFFSIDWYAYFYRTMFIRQSITHSHHSFIHSHLFEICRIFHWIHVYFYITRFWDNNFNSFFFTFKSFLLC